MIYFLIYFIAFVGVFIKSRCQSDMQSTEEKEVPFIHESGFVNVHVDGFCVNNGKENARAGVGIWFNYDHPLNTFKAVEGKPTNVNADLFAALTAINCVNANGIYEVMIHTDSLYLIKCMTRWINNWKENNFMTQMGTPVKNRETLEKLDEAVSSMQKVYWIHVPGPNLEKGNFEAEQLAIKGADQYAKIHNVPLRSPPNPNPPNFNNQQPGGRFNGNAGGYGYKSNWRQQDRQYPNQYQKRYQQQSYQQQPYQQQPYQQQSNQQQPYQQQSNQQQPYQQQSNQQQPYQQQSYQGNQNYNRQPYNRF